MNTNVPSDIQEKIQNLAGALKDATRYLGRPIAGTYTHGAWEYSKHGFTVMWNHARGGAVEVQAILIWFAKPSERQTIYSDHAFVPGPWWDKLERFQGEVVDAIKAAAAAEEEAKRQAALAMEREWMKLHGSDTPSAKTKGGSSNSEAAQPSVVVLVG